MSYSAENVAALSPEQIAELLNKGAMAAQALEDAKRNSKKSIRVTVSEKGYVRVEGFMSVFADGKSVEAALTKFMAEKGRDALAKEQAWDKLPAVEKLRIRTEAKAKRAARMADESDED